MAENNVIKYDEAVKKLTEDFRKQISAVSETVEVYNKLHTSMSNLPSNVVNQINAINTANEKLTKTNNDLVISSQKAEKAEKTRVQQILTTGASLEKQKTREIALEEKSQALLTKSENLYNKIQAKVNQTSQAYNNLAAKKEIGLTLTDKEQRSLALLEARMTKYSGVLKTVDANVGKYNRNVGNYASGWNGLSHNINQITREMPAFAVSMNTGFLALSNNIPMLFDEIKKTKDGIAQLRAEGKPTESLFTKLASSLFSWQTALSLGVTLLTIYGAEIGKWIIDLAKGQASLSALAESQKQYSEAVKDGTKSAQQEIQELRVLTGVAQNNTLSTKERTKAVDELQSRYPEYFGNMSKEQVMNQDLTRVTKELTSALISRAIAIASINKMTENASKILDLEEEKRLEDEKLKTLEKQAKTQAEITKSVLTTTTRDEAYTTGRLQTATTNVLSTKRKIAETDKEINRLAEINTRLSEKAISNQATGSKTVTTRSGGGGRTVTPSAVGVNQSLEDRTRLLIEIQKQEQKTAEATLKRQMAEAEQANDMEMFYSYKQMLALNDFEYGKKIADLEIKDAEQLKAKKEQLLQEFLLSVIEVNKEEGKVYDKAYDEAVKDYEKFLEKRKKAGEDASQAESDAEYKRLIDKFANQEKLYQDAQAKIKENASLSSVGFGSLDMFFETDDEGNNVFLKTWENLETTEEKVAFAMMAIQSVTADAFNAMKASSDAYFENQFNQLEKEYDVAVKYAGDSEEAKKALDEKYAERKLQLRRQQAKEEKNMAIFSAVINIATGITASLAQGGPVGIVLAALIGALGAVQIASIASQPLPAFWKGTDNAPEGWALTQEKGAEVITDKQGNVKTMGNSKGAQLTYLSKGDKVYKNRDDFFKSLNSDMSSTNVVAMSNDFDYQQIDSIFGKHIQSIQPHSINFDERGMKVFIGSERNRTELLNKRINFKKR